ncbi:MAG: DUF3536 domain-containing protein [Saprospiraceae bacterium]
MASNKFVCIHGHFYQPPRENAWLEVIELQESAAPFHDWNERINFECYAPNAAARILNEAKEIRKIVNNYARISFNFGPTLLDWLEKEDPGTYQSILNADADSVLEFGGHGNAMAQGYNHMILPLADELDKETQVLWGIADFRHRFGRAPEGMWLPETAADLPTLEALVKHGIKFTVLAPRQAKAFRKIGDEEWVPLDENIDPRRPYRCFLPSGKYIDLFFYDGGNAKAVAFEGLLNKGEYFAGRMLSVFDNDDSPQLSHIATDGESYGHHHRFGEMALAHCLDFIDEGKEAEIINYGLYLERFPPEYEVQIHEPSSWSCVHGVERWRSNCGCSDGGQPGWTQEWRGPLRDALDWLRDELRKVFEDKAGVLLKDIWAARNDYIQVILNREKANVKQFLKRHAVRELSAEETTTVLRMLEMQRHCMLMYTSCAWFFAEISGIETNQVLQYALRAIRHAAAETGQDLSPELEKRMELAPSNVYKNGAESFRINVLPSEMNLTRVGMHYAASCVFEDYEKEDEFLHFEVQNDFFDRKQAGFQRLAFGRTSLVSDITWSVKKFSFVVLYLGQQNIFGSVGINMPLEEFMQKQRQMEEAFKSSSLGDTIEMIHGFGTELFSFRHLFKDEKRKFLNLIMARNLPPVETAIRDYFEDNYQLMVGMKNSNIPIPEGWKSIAQYIINRDLYEFFRNGNLKVKTLIRLADEFERWNLNLTNEEALSLAAGERIFAEIQKVGANEAGLKHLNSIIQIIEALDVLDVHPELWKTQNLYYQLTEGYRRGDWVYINKEWQLSFEELGRLLKIAMK